jgi:hypothetical protein
MVSQLRVEFDLTCGLFDLTCGEDIFVHYICVLTQIYKFSALPVREAGWEVGGEGGVKGDLKQLFERKRK